MLGLEEKRTIPIEGVLQPSRSKGGSLFRKGFQGVVAQFKEAGYPLESASFDFFFKFAKSI